MPSLADTAPDRRRYDMSCPIACALDLAGERWTLLILRELLPGPLRFSEIKGAVPGINATILSRRLDQMASEGLVGLAEMGSTTGYAATARALTLWPLLFTLAVFGLQTPAQATTGGLTPVAAVTAFIANRPAKAPRLAIGFSLGGPRLEWQPDHRAPLLRKPGRATLEITTAPDLLYGLVTGQNRWAEVQDRLTLEGEAGAFLDHLPG